MFSKAKRFIYPKVEDPPKQCCSTCSSRQLIAASNKSLLESSIRSMSRSSKLSTSMQSTPKPKIPIMQKRRSCPKLEPSTSKAGSNVNIDSSASNVQQIRRFFESKNANLDAKSNSHRPSSIKSIELETSKNLQDTGAIPKIIKKKQQNLDSKTDSSKNKIMDISQKSLDQCSTKSEPSTMISEIVDTPDSKNAPNSRYIDIPTGSGRDILELIKGGASSENALCSALLPDWALPIRNYIDSLKSLQEEYKLETQRIKKELELAKIEHQQFKQRLIQLRQSNKEYLLINRLRQKVVDVSHRNSKDIEIIKYRCDQIEKNYKDEIKNMHEQYEAMILNLQTFLFMGNKEKKGNNHFKRKLLRFQEIMMARIKKVAEDFADIENTSDNLSSTLNAVFIELSNEMAVIFASEMGLNEESDDERTNGCLHWMKIKMRHR